MKICLLLLGIGVLSVRFLPAQTLSRESRNSGLGAPISNLGREKDALYLEDVLKKPLKLKVKADAIVYNNLGAERRLGVIPAGTLVNVVAINDKALRVRGKAEHDDVSGWVGRAFLEELDPRITETLTKMMERQKLVDELIRQKTVAIGMTSAEVDLVLGAPSKRTSRVDKTGQVEIYEYITYRIIPQQVAQRDQNGQVFYTLVNNKVETGRRTLTFENRVVSAIEESEAKAPKSGIVPIPIEIDLMER